MQEILIDRRQFIFQNGVQKFDDVLITLHPDPLLLFR